MALPKQSFLLFQAVPSTLAEPHGIAQGVHLHRCLELVFPENSLFCFQKFVGEASGPGVRWGTVGEAAAWDPLGSLHHML